MNKEKLKVIAKDTLSICNLGFYKNKHNDKIIIKNNDNYSIKSSRLYKPSQDILNDRNISKYIDETDVKLDIEVTDETSFKCGERLYREGYSNIAILNFASATNPGGGFLKGAVAQEECLARQSSMYNCIVQFNEMYEYNKQLKTSLYSDYMIYSPKVPFFKDDNYELLDKPIYLSIITSPSVNKGRIIKNEPYNLSKIDTIMEKRIDKIFEVAIENNVDALVLGAFGCGVFKNNPKDVCRYFNKSIDKYGKYFKKIVFPVYDTSIEKFNYTTFLKEIKN